MVKCLNDIGVRALDLDQELTRRSSRSVASLFEDGEASFRDLEIQVFSQICKEGQAQVVALGAGFEGSLPKEARVVWLHRPTDYQGRSFTDRPRLNKSISPKQEYFERFEARNLRYASGTNEHLMLPEGYESGLEDFLMAPEGLHCPYDMTLTPDYFEFDGRVLRDRSMMSFRRFELRDDLLSLEQIHLALELIPRERLILARRTHEGNGEIDLLVDWACELGIPHSDVEILSLHERRADWRSTLREFSFDAAPIMKLAAIVETWAELLAGHQWWQENPEQRAFLPRSLDGRWQWYRQLFGPQMPLHFVREHLGSALDQPFLWQTLLGAQMKGEFAAVLGDPVVQSRTPLEHLEFFSMRGAPVVSVQVSEAEFEHEAMPVLQQLGLRWAAVTSPLKLAAYNLANQKSARAIELESVNTIAVRQKQTFAHNTDIDGLIEMAAELKRHTRVVIWGGGGTLKALLQCWPEASVYSARTGELRQGPEVFDECDLLIWAAGERGSELRPSFRAKEIFDLSYAESSSAKAWAVEREIPYQSGLKMFKVQAQAQREFWSQIGKQ